MEINLTPFVLIALIFVIALVIALVVAVGVSVARKNKRDKMNMDLFTDNSQEDNK